MDTKIKVTGKCEYVGPVEKPRENFTKRTFVLGETTDNGKTRFLQFTLMIPSVHAYGRAGEVCDGSAQGQDARSLRLHRIAAVRRQERDAALLDGH